MAELRVTANGSTRVLPFEKGARLSEVLKNAGIDCLRPCGGRGVCGKCAVELHGEVSPPDQMEEKAGTRLVCRAILLGDAEAILPETRRMESIELGRYRKLAPRDPMPGKYGAAIDIGTTTVALSLFDLASGECLAECGVLNPQASVSSDVMGRIGAACSGELSRLQTLVTGAVDGLLDRASAEAGIEKEKIESLTVTGNTAMLYLLTGRNPETLSHAPFEADCLFDGTVELGGREAYLPPSMHAFVGADITCALVSSGLCERREASLLADVGTNGEIALWKDGKLLVTSTAAGPAFEGAGISCGVGSVRGAIDRVELHNGELTVSTIGNAPAVGVCGSGLIDAVAAGLQRGDIDETGAMEEDDLPLTGAVRLLPRDIRAVQLAKSAVAAGILTLLETAALDPETLARVYVAGGFGSHMNIESAVAIGLFPAFIRGKQEILGNAALLGAAELLLDRGLRREARRIASLAEHVDLGGNPRFNGHYMDEMMFPEV